MINLEDLTVAVNELLGRDKFAVYLNSNAFPDDEEDRIVVTMSALRIPFGFSTEELDAESLTVTLTFDLPCDVYGEQSIVRDGALERIQETLLGRKEFFVNQTNGEQYTVNAFLEQQPPANPYADSGRITQQIVLSGKMLVQNVNCAAIVGNDVRVSIGLEGAYTETELLKVSRASSLDVGTDSNIPLSENSTLAETYGISRTCTKTLNFLYTGKKIEDHFLKIAEGFDHDVNAIYTYKVKYPTFTVQSKFKLISVSSQDSAGVYLQYTLTAQIVGSALIVAE